MKTFLKVVAFSIGVILFYTFYASSMIPQIIPAPPPLEAKLDMGSLTMESFIQMGGDIFYGKGTCELCHNPVGGRAPLLDQVAAIAAERLGDPRYKGKATTGEEYIRESMAEPSAFVVVGFGVTGTNDTQSPMPNVTTGAIGLKPFEVDAVIAYLQEKAGVEVTVKLPELEPAEGGAEAAPAAPASTPEEIVAKYGCGACHKIAGEAGALGPDLTKIGGKKNRDFLRKAVIDPNADIAPGFPPGMMPPDFGQRMFASELEMLVEYMAKSK